MADGKPRSPNSALALLLFTLICLLLPEYGYGKYIEGHLVTREEWAFLGRFCFLSERGRLKFEFEYPQKDYEPQNILLYFDSEDQWPAVYKSDKTCKEKLEPVDSSRMIKLDSTYGECVKNGLNIWCSGYRVFASARPRWWYLAASHCDHPKGLNLKYKLTMTNGDDGDIFFKHFSADEFYILQVDIAFLLIFFVMFVVSIVCGVMLRNRQLFHTTYKLYMTSLFCEVFYLLIMCIAYGKYAYDGRENTGLKTFGRIFESAGTLTFLLMLILMGKGYTITRGRLSTCGSIKIAVFMTLYTITYAVLFIYEAQFFDPGEVLYLYESPPGYGLIGLRLLSWIWFCYAIFFTLKHFPEKSAFFYPFFIFYTIWFWATPVIILVANFVMDKWVRSKVVNAINLTIDFCALVYFLFLTRPTAANKNFPYHVRTSQIGVMNTPPPPANGGIPMSASTESESFTRYAYAPADPPPPYPMPTANFSELFTVSNTHTSKETANMDQFPHQRTGENPFVVTR